MAEDDPRQRLLDLAVAYVAEHGIGDLSLRTLASAIGTSHRMLIHHFGSKEELWVAIVNAVEERERTSLEQFFRDAPADPIEQMRAWWKHISDPGLWPNERLFFELYARALQGDPGSQGVLADTIGGWVRAVSDLQDSRELPVAATHAQVRLGIAVTRGLLLDLLATGDVVGVDAAMDAYLSLWQTQLEAGSGERRG
jgi:AcrR family transcriptional regulator